MKDFKICLIGCGNMSRTGHAPSLKKYAEEHECINLAACCDLRKEVAEEFCQLFGFKKAYTDYMEMVENETPDVVVAITPVNLTKDITVSLLEKGIPVFMEKPPGLNLEENIAIHNAAINNNTPAKVGFNRRYTPLVTALKNEIKEAGAPVLDVNCNFIRVGRTHDFATTAVHGIDTVKFIADSNYISADLRYKDFEFNGKNVTNIQLSGQLENGATVSATFSPCGGCTVERITVSLIGYTFFMKLPVWDGSDVPGELICMKDDKVYKVISGDDLVDSYSLHESNGFYAASQGFFDMLRNGERPLSDVISGKDSVEISDCIRFRKTEYIRK